MEHIDVRASIDIYFGVENNHTDLKFKVGDRLRISKFKKRFLTGYKLNWEREDFSFKKFKLLYHEHMLLKTFMQKKL